MIIKITYDEYTEETRLSVSLYNEGLSVGAAVLRPDGSIQCLEGPADETDSGNLHRWYHKVLERAQKVPF